MGTELYEAGLQYLLGIFEDLRRPSVPIIWAVLLLALYFMGWWHGNFERLVLVFVVTLFVTCPHGRGLMVVFGLAGLLWVQAAKTPPVELKGLAQIEKDASKMASPERTDSSQKKGTR